jgi:glycerol-3-phosphate dehydrogenase
VVIGGGATGLGTAVDAVARGYRTLLLEARDFAHGTSSRSSKLIHGGVRYLAQANITLVREALHERWLLLQNAPHIVHTRDFVVPAQHYWQLPYYATGLWLYDRLAGSLCLSRSRWISRDEVIARIPTIRPAHLRGGIVYTDGQFDDARMAIELARTLSDLGGCALNYVSVSALLKQDGRIHEVRALDEETGEEFRISAKAVVNATGVHADAVRRLDEPDLQPLLTPSQGAHIVLDSGFLPGQTGLMVPKTDDGRVLFAIPWIDRVLVGTTDTSIASLPLEPRPLNEEIDYLLNHAGRYLDKAPERTDIKSMFAGLRPLIKPARSRGTATAKLSREHAVLVSHSGLITITGGKWTTYRRMAKDAVDHAARVGTLPGRPCATASLKLHGWQLRAHDETEHLTAYGSDQSSLEDLICEHAGWNEPIHLALPYLCGEVIWAARYEAARTVEDVLSRRTRALILDAGAALEAAPRAAALLAHELGKDATWQADQVDRFKTLAAYYTVNSI